MNNGIQMLAFSVDGGIYALRLSEVERVVGAVEITHLAHAPAAVAGVINLHGEIVPVIDLRRCFDRPPRELACDDEFILARRAGSLVALWVDRVQGVMDCAPEEIVSRPDLTQDRVLRLADGMAMVCDLDALLGEADGRALDMAMDPCCAGSGRGGP